LRQLQGVVDATPERVGTAPERASSAPGRVASAPAEIAETYLVETEPGRLAAADLARAIVGQGFDLSELVEVKPDLERVFLDLTRRASATETNAA
jgi:ABC-2 type transport system ATP-binding protein